MTKDGGGGGGGGCGFDGDGNGRGDDSNGIADWARFDVSSRQEVG